MSNFVNPFSIHQAALESPDALFLVQNERKWTFREVSEQVQRIAQDVDQHESALRDVSCVAFAAPISVATIFWMLFLLEKSVPFLPLHSKMPDVERAHLLERLGFDLAPQCLGGCRAFWISNTKKISNHTLCLIQTSGSSSAKPKAVVLSNEAWIASCKASGRNLGWEENDRWLLSIPISHVGGLSILLRCLMARKTVVLSQQLTQRFDPQFWIQEVQSQSVTLVSLVPTMLRRILEVLKKGELENLRAILVGGAACSNDLITAARKLKLPVLTTYGMTETCSQIATVPFESRFENLSSGGRVLSGNEIRILNEEIWVKGKSLLDGYLTEEGLVDPKDAEGWFRTGDLGAFNDEGFLFVRGRADRRIVTGGENVDPSEVEQILLRYPDIAQAFVLGMDDKQWGERVVAGVVFRAASSENWADDQQRILDFCKRHLSSFKCPKEIFQIKSVPLKQNGKVDVQALKTKLLDKSLGSFGY